MKLWHWICLGIITLGSIIAEFTMQPDAVQTKKYWWASIPLFYIAFGFLGCLVIMFVSKALGKWILQKREDYYDAE